MNNLIETGRLVKAVWGDICLFGVYAPNDNAGEDTIKNFFQGLWNEVEITMPNKYIAICGDFNAKIAGYWSNVNNLGGEMTNMIVEMADLMILNSKNEPTRREQKGPKILKSIIDFTLVSKELTHHDHKVINNSPVYSDHLPICFTIEKQMGTIR